MYTSSPNKRAFAVTAIVWGGFGALLGRRGSALARFAIGSLGLAETGLGFQLITEARNSIKVIIEPQR